MCSSPFLMLLVVTTSAPLGPTAVLATLASVMAFLRHLLSPLTLAVAPCLYVAPWLPACGPLYTGHAIYSPLVSSCLADPFLICSPLTPVSYGALHTALVSSCLVASTDPLAPCCLRSSEHGHAIYSPLVSSCLAASADPLFHLQFMAALISCHWRALLRPPLQSLS
ncbi:hypothetical protein GOP47_0021144, partial [Adiantum capillus-veneris]